MKISYIQIGLIFLFFVVNAVYSSNLEYSILNFPDSIFSDSNLTFQIEIKNKSKNPVILKSFPIAFDVHIKKNNIVIQRQKINYLSDEFMSYQLDTGKNIVKRFDSPLFYCKDTMYSLPKPKYSGCSTNKDFLLANIIGLPSPITIKKHLLKGLYQVLIYAYIVDRNDRKDYFRFERKLKIK